MKNTFITVLLVLILSGCVAPVSHLDPGSTTTNPPEFVSIDPRSTPWFEEETSTGVRRVFWKELNNEQVNINLPIERSFISILRQDLEGNIHFATAKFTGDIGKYKIILDYAKYRDEVISGIGVPCRVGVGVRIVANVNTAKANLDLGSLFAIAFAAKSGYLNGQIEVLKIGIDSSRLSLMLPPPADINDTSLQNAMQAVAAIRAKLYDTDTRLTPHVLALQYTPETIDAKP